MRINIVWHPTILKYMDDTGKMRHLRGKIHGAVFEGKAGHRDRILGMCHHLFNNIYVISFSVGGSHVSNGFLRYSLGGDLLS